MADDRQRIGRHGPDGDTTTGESEDTPSLAEQIRTDPKVRARYVRWRARKGAARNPAAAIPNSSGAPLANGVRGTMERQLGADLSDVRVHAGSQSAEAADELGARAFTVDRDVHFGTGEFSPGSKEGDRLLAHELTHVVQGQRSGIQRKAAEPDAGHGDADSDSAEVSSPDEPAEKEADHVADGVADRLHGDGAKQAEHSSGGHDEHAQAGEGGKEKAPAIGAKLTATVGRKIFRSRDKAGAGASSAAGADDKKAGALKLSGSSGALSLKASDEAQWPEQVGKFLAKELATDPKKLTVQTLKGGRSGDLVFSVKLAGQDLGVLKVFKDEAATKAEVSLLRALAQKQMKEMKVVGEKGTAPAEVDGNKHASALLMDTAQGTSVDSMIKNVPPPTSPERAHAIETLKASVVHTARGMAEMHDKFASGDAMSAGAKKSDADHMLGKIDRLKSKLAGRDYDTVLSKFRDDLIPAFMKSPVPATAYHGDANCGNFIVDKSFNVTVIDVGSMKYSLDDKGKGTKTGAADVGRFMQSLEASHPGKLNAGEIAQLQKAFTQEYFAHSKVKREDFDAGITLYRAELELAALKNAAGKDETAASLKRLGGILKVSLGGGK